MITSAGLGQYAAGENHLLVLPKHFRGDGTHIGVIVPHAAAQMAFDSLYLSGVGTLADAGYPVISTDMGGSLAWANDTAQARMTDAKNYLQGTAGAKAGKVLVYGGSMGALTALVWAMNNPTLVLGVGGIIPVVNLADVHDNNRGGHAASIETAYGGAAGYAAAVAAHNPAANPGLLASMPIKLWTGGNDAVATPGAASAFVAAVGSNASVTSLGAGVDHATGNAAFDPQQIVKFFNSLDG